MLGLDHSSVLYDPNVGVGSEITVLCCTILYHITVGSEITVLCSTIIHVGVGSEISYVFYDPTCHGW